MILDPRGLEAGPCFPEFPCSWQGLSFGGIEPCGIGEIDDEGSDVEAVEVRWRPADAANAEKAQEDVEAPDHLGIDDGVGRRVGFGAGHVVQVVDMAGGDDVEGETLAQVVGGIELTVHQPGAGLEYGEPRLDGPAAFVPADDTARLLRRRLSLGGEQQPVQWRGVSGRCDLGGLTRKALERRISVGPEEAGSQSSTVANQLAFLAQPDLLVNTSESTFDPGVISDGNTDLFIVVPDDMVGEVRAWLRLWITIPNAIPNRQALDRDLLLIIDEMPRLGFLKPVMDAYNLAAGKGVHFWCFSQSISALEATWGREQTRILIDLAEVVQILGFPRTDAAGAESMAKAIGQATFEAPSTSQSGTVSEQRVLMTSSQIQTGESTQLVREFLVQPDDLMTLPPDEQYVVAAGKALSRNALHLHHARYWERSDARRLADGNPFVLRKASGGLTSPPTRPQAQPDPPAGATAAQPAAAR